MLHRNLCQKTSHVPALTLCSGIEEVLHSFGREDLGHDEVIGVFADNAKPRALYNAYRYFMILVELSKESLEVSLCLK